MKKRIVVVIVLMAIFSLGLAVAISGSFQGYELAFAKFLNPDGNHNIILRIFTEIGEYYGVIPIVALLLCLKGRRRIGLPVGVATLTSWILNESLKRIVQRPRPEFRLLEVSNFSFPSGHAMNNAALYISLLYCILRLAKTKQQKILCTVILTLHTFIIGISRVYFNVHYISDVISGWCLGISIALVVCPLILKLTEKENRGV